jgi:hypothetical protein
MRLYVNGELIETVPIAEDTPGEIGYFMVGQPATRYYEYEDASNRAENAPDRQGWAMRDGFVGVIDEIRIYNTLLGAEQVAALYAAGTACDAEMPPERIEEFVTETQTTVATSAVHDPQDETPQEPVKRGAGAIAAIVILSVALCTGIAAAVILKKNKNGKKRI